jgi:hypothetical protein
MADIDVERKSGMSWLWRILGLILLALIIWWFVAAADDDEVAEVVEPAPIVTPTTTPEVIAAGPRCLGEVITDPATFVGEVLDDCSVSVVEVPSDRGFWVEEDGVRMFAIINDQPAEQPKDINPGQQLRLSQAWLYDNVANLPGDLDADTRRIAQEAGYFLNVDEANIAILEGGVRQPGTTPAATISGDTM